MDSKIKIIITEDKEPFRKLLRRELADFDIATIAEAGNGIELLQQLQSHQPDVILLDLRMPVMNGSETMTRLSEEYPDKKIIVLSTYDNQLLMEDYYKRGARGWIIKDDISGDIEHLAGIIKKVHRGGKHFNYNSENEMLAATERQRDIIQLSASGKSRREIGEQIGVTENYVGKQEKKIMAKMGISNLAGFFTFLGRAGLEFLRGPRPKK